MLFLFVSSTIKMKRGRLKTWYDSGKLPDFNSFFFINLKIFPYNHLAFVMQHAKLLCNQKPLYYRGNNKVLKSTLLRLFQNDWLKIAWAYFESKNIAWFTSVMQLIFFFMWPKLIWKIESYGQILGHFERKYYY